MNTPLAPLVQHIPCKPCMARGYKPEARRSGKGFYARTCRSCGGSGYVATVQFVLAKTNLEKLIGHPIQIH